MVQYLDTIEEVEGRAPPVSHWDRVQHLAARIRKGASTVGRIEIDDVERGICLA